MYIWSNLNIVTIIFNFFTVTAKFLYTAWILSLEIYSDMSSYLIYCVYEGYKKGNDYK